VSGGLLVESPVLLALLKVFSFFRLADASKSSLKLFHKTNIALAGLLPIAFILPSSMAMPVDVVLGLIVPFHMHVGMNGVISDYVPKATRGLARGAMLVVTVLTAAGLLKLNLSGPGMTRSIKSLWCAPSNTKGENSKKCPVK
jgi:succinate dehydrogenase (ubiquinone) membrane anchor subunit